MNMLIPVAVNQSEPLSGTYPGSTQTAQSGEAPAGTTVLWLTHRFRFSSRHRPLATFPTLRGHVHRKELTEQQCICARCKIIQKGASLC